MLAYSTSAWNFPVGSRYIGNPGGICEGQANESPPCTPIRHESSHRSVCDTTTDTIMRLAPPSHSIALRSILACPRKKFPSFVPFSRRRGDWRAGASQPSRSAGTIFLYVYLFIYVYPGAAHTVMFYVLLNMR